MSSYETRDSHAPTTTSGHGAEMVYTCPMHPEIRQPEPGDCPKCGMHLVPEAKPASTITVMVTVTIMPTRPVTRRPEKAANTILCRRDIRDLSIPARCTRKSAAPNRDPARSAAWDWNLKTRRWPTRGPNPELVDFTHRLWVALS